MLERIRRRLTLGYVGIFALIFVLLGAFAVVGFSRELTEQQDVLLAQEARNQASNLLNDEQREVLATGSPEFSWIALDLQGGITDSDPVAASLGLPSAELAQEALEEDGVVSATIQGSDDSGVRAVSMPMYDEAGEVVGVIQYARSLGEIRENVNRLLLVLLPLGLGALGLAAFGGLYMAGRAVRPVRDSFDKQRAFVADASHELKTPLTLIRADTEVVLYRGRVDPDDRKLIEHVLAETDRMNAVLSDLLLVARLDAGKLDVSTEPFDLSVVLSESVERFGLHISGKGVDLEVRTAGRLPVRGDPKRTGQILAVLLDNAVRFTPSGGRITVDGQLHDGWVEVSVRDTGPGIAPEHLPRIFDRFYRAEEARTRKSGGTGLGLAIARDLARAQKGDLQAENVKGGGTVFRLVLPKG
jgi:signal transduction histidine kinase